MKSWVWSGWFIVLVLVMFSTSQLTSSDNLHDILLRTTTDNTFLPGPNGELCILHQRDDHDPTFEHRNDQGGRCCCSLCKPRQYVGRFCQCEEKEETPSIGKDTECVPVRSGLQYMDKHNRCTQPYECTARCNAHQHVVSQCNRTANLRCKCNDGWFNPNPSDTGSVPQTCRPMPTCPAGEEPRKHERAGQFEFVCEPCPSGYFKSEGDSWRRCKPHRDCVIHRGNAVADTVCLNDVVTETSSPKTLKPPAPTTKNVPTPSDSGGPPNPSQHPHNTPEQGTSEETSSLADDEDEYITCKPCPSSWSSACCVALAVLICIVFIVFMLCACRKRIVRFLKTSSQNRGI